jgi:hypothetical protein
MEQICGVHIVNGTNFLPSTSGFPCHCHSTIATLLVVIFVTLTEVFPWFSLSCKVKCEGKTRKDGARPALFHIRFGCYLCCSMYYLCVNVYCNRVTTQLQLINISYHISEGQAGRACGPLLTYLLTPWSRVLLEKLTSELCS